MSQYEYEFDGFALQPGSAVCESIDAAGLDCHLPERDTSAGTDDDNDF